MEPGPPPVNSTTKSNILKFSIPRKRRANNKNGKTDGINLSFYENGKLTEKSTWINGKIDGIREQYDINGNLELKQIYEDGNLILPDTFCGYEQWHEY
mgnify:CR=1 FL=1